MRASLSKPERMQFSRRAGTSLQDSRLEDLRSRQTPRWDQELASLPGLAFARQPRNDPALYQGDLFF